MNETGLMRLVSEHDELAPHLEFLRKIAKPRVNIELTVDQPTDACSRFGGNPFLPRTFDWPLHEVGQYRFLGQINFAEIEDSPAILPQTGLLSLFFAHDDDGLCFWRDDGYVRGFFWDDFSNHAIFTQPSAGVTDTRRIRLTGGIDLPKHQELRKDWPFARQILYQLVDAIDADREYLLGYPSFNTLAYDPTPGPEWISLLTVGSLDEFDWCWHDGDTLMVFIESSKLLQKDFGYLKSDAG